MSVDKSTCKNVPIEGQTSETIASEGNLLEFNTKHQTCTIGEQHLSKNLKISNDEIKFKNNYFEILPKEAHCNLFEIEKWEDWFTIPYYYINNKYDKGTNDEKNKRKYSVPVCYKPCESNSVVKTNKNECESINTFMRGKYKDFIPYDPFAIIAIIGTKYNSDYSKNEALRGSYKYHIENLKINNKDILPDTIREDIDIDNSKLLEKKGYESINSSVDKAYLELEEYINFIDSESLTKDNKTLVKEKIISDINKFYNLFDTRDEFYMNYLKKIKYTDKPNFGNYQGARYAFHIAKDNTNVIKKIDTEINKLEIIKFMFNYCCNLCFSNKYLFNDRLKNYGILESGTNAHQEEKNGTPAVPGSNDYITPIVNNNNYTATTEYETTNVNINKEDIPAFSEYEYVFKYFKNLSILGPFMLLIIVLLLLLYWVLDKLGFLGKIMRIINFLIIYFINLSMNSMYYFAYYVILIFGLIIVHPLNIIMLKLTNIIIFIVLLFIILLADPLSALNIGINMRPLAFVLLDFVYITLVQLIKLFIKLIIIIFSYTAVSVPILIYVFYTLYKITYQDLSILSDPHINFTPYKSGIMMIHFQKMRVDYFNNVLSNHIDLVKNLGKNN
uniref:Uncharacterized protein n=1 Tax=Virus NIOZ-UU159 TaxID=2763270 RepID=A0A7S9SV40_9VIRU|nr:MAG: hypothetical protein NIOZUU159_00288 [Virus NIOZ-UU159]